MPYTPNAGFLGRGLPLIDATNWPSTVTVTQTYDYDSRVNLPQTAPGFTAPMGDGSYTTIRGTATFTWTRARLAGLIASPSLPCVDFVNVAPVPDQQFLAVQCALGNLPGWSVQFGTQPAQTGAFTQTHYPAPNATVTGPDGSQIPAQPVPTMLDANAPYIFMICAPCAPGRFVATEYYVGAGSTSLSAYAGGAFASINQGLAGDPSNTGTDTPCDVTLLQAGFPANPDTGQREIGPVYRVSAPSDATSIGGVSVTLNGTTGNGLPEPDGLLANGALQAGIVDALGFFASVDTIPRSATVCDVWCRAASDVLSSVVLSSFSGSMPVDSTVSYGGPPATLDDPFNLPGQSFTDTSAQASQGFTVIIQF